MDTPNAPNPTNPKTQDQFVDAVQGPEADASFFYFNFNVLR